MLLQSIPLSSLISSGGVLTLSINFDLNPQLCPSTDMRPHHDEALSYAERRVIQLINLPAKNIADQLNLSVNTVKKHIRNLFEKTGCQSNVQLAIWAERNKFLN